MIVVRAPFRISFVGGGTDLPDFYHKHPGRVISATINQYIYIVINPTPMVSKVSARYVLSETVDHPNKLKHTRIKAALKELGIMSNIEIGSFASIPARTGLGSSSSFSVALMKALNLHKNNKKLSPGETAEAACRLEIDLLGEPIGKQDQYAAAHGGFNIFQFNPDESVDIKPVLLGYKANSLLEDHMLLFYTGITRSASKVLGKQRMSIKKKIKDYQEMTEMVPIFEKELLAGNMKNLAKLLHQGWLKKKSLSAGISNPLIDNLYQSSLKAGAWGGKILGAGAGGCLMLIAPTKKHKAIRAKMVALAKKNKLKDFQEIPVKFVQSGAEVLFNDNHTVL
ncbi:MAG: GHMP kinase [Patescibacteria group bacterium]